MQLEQQFLVINRSKGVVLGPFGIDQAMKARGNDMMSLVIKTMNAKADIESFRNSMNVKAKYSSPYRFHLMSEFQKRSLKDAYLSKNKDECLNIIKSCNIANICSSCDNQSDIAYQIAKYFVDGLSEG